MVPDPLHVGMYHLGLLASSGWGFSLVQRYNSTLPDWQKTPGDRHFIGDFTGDGKANLSLFNSSNWSIAYLELLQLNGSGLSMAPARMAPCLTGRRVPMIRTLSPILTGMAKPICSYIMSRTGRHHTWAG